MDRRRKSLWIGLFVVLLECLHVRAISTREFYPFGATNGDRRMTRNDDGSSGEVPISVSFPFFKDTYNSLYVNTNGVISFIDNLEEFTPDAFPVENSRRLIAPFWADVDTRNGGNVFYRESKSLEVLQRATKDVKKYFQRQFTSFQASWVFIATWHNVAHFIKAGSFLSGHAKTARNTFQAVLITNGRHSFALFLYNKTDWTTGDASKGRNGQGGIPAQAGFNYGDGVRYHSIRGSRTRLIKLLPSLTNIGVPGKFAFRIDEADIKDGGCNTGGGLTLSPTRGNVLGGAFIKISGPCFKSSNVIVCRFNGTTVVEGNYINKYTVSCVSPPLHRIGKIPLELSLDNGRTFRFSSSFTSVPLGRHGPEISGIVSKDWISHLNPLFLAWDPLDLISQRVHIEVAKFDWKTLELLDKNTLIKADVPNFGFHEVRDLVETALAMPNISQTDSEKYVSPLAIVTIRAETPERGPPARVFSAPFLLIPTNRNISIETKNAFKNLGIPQSCKQWFAEDIFDVPKILDELIGCPMSLEQAEADSGRFTSDDYCKPPRTSACMTYHNGSYHCFRTIFPSPSGAGQQCCYTKQGRLVVGPPGGGTIDKFHAKSSRFATLKHLKEDIYPWYLCCRLSRRCGLYYENRPSDNGSQYSPPEIATTFGDPHLITLDGVSFTFNGHGEYTMLCIEDIGFVFQARMQPRASRPDEQSRGTFLMAFALKDSEGDTVQIELNSLMMIDIFVNGEEELFTPKTSQLDFSGFILAKRNESMIQVMFKSGIVVNIKQNELSLSFDMLLPDAFKGKTKGLLGVWDGNKENDFTLPNGQRIPITSTGSEIHYEFGQKWLTEASQSLFIYHDGKKHEDYVNRRYKPMFLDDFNMVFASKRQEKKARELCGGVKECLFDVVASGRLSFGNSTKQALEEFKEKKKNITTVRIPLYFNCDGQRVSDARDACGSRCRIASDHTVAIILAIIFCIIAAVTATMIVVYYLRRNRPEPKKVEPPKPAPTETEKPCSEPTVMAFVLPQFTESKKIKKVY